MIEHCREDQGGATKIYEDFLEVLDKRPHPSEQLGASDTDSAPSNQLRAVLCSQFHTHIVHPI
jgi:hypothetical protein